MPSSALAAPPVNDEIQGALPLEGDGSERIMVDVDMAEATASASDPACGLTPQQSVWYRFTSPIDQFVEGALSASEGSTGIRPRLSVWSGRPGALELEDCNADAHSVHLEAKAGTTYYFEVYSPVAAGETTVRLGLLPFSIYGARPPPTPQKNDLFWYRERIAQIPWTAHVDFSGGTRDSNYDYPPYWTHGSLGPRPSLWYEFTATRREQLDAVFTSEEGNDGPIHVMAGTLDDPVPIADNSSVVGRSAARFTTEPGVTYKIVFMSAASWPYIVTQADVALRPSPPPNRGTVTASKVVPFYPYLQWAHLGIFGDVPWRWTKHVEVQLDVTCASPIHSMQVDIKLKQRGRVVLRNTGFVPCQNGRGSGTVDGTSSAIRAGLAELTVHVSDFETNYDFTTAPIPVQLTRVPRP